MENDLKSSVSKLIENWSPLYLAGVSYILFPIWIISSHSLTPAANFMIVLWILIGAGLLFRVKLALLIAILGLPFGYCFDFLMYLLNVKSPFGDMAFYFVPPSSLILSLITDLFASDLYYFQFSEETFLRVIYYYVHLLILIPPYGGRIISKRTYFVLFLLTMLLCGIYEMVFSFNGPFRKRDMNLIHGALIGTYIWVAISFLKKFEHNIYLRLGGAGTTYSFNKADDLPQKGNLPELLRAVKMGNLDRVKSLLENGVNVNEKFDSGLSALIVAAKTENLEVVKTLLRSGADVNEKTESGMTALRVASEKGHIEIVKRIVGCWRGNRCNW